MNEISYIMINDLLHISLEWFPSYNYSLAHYIQLLTYPIRMTELTFKLNHLYNDAPLVLAPNKQFKHMPISSFIETLGHLSISFMTDNREVHMP